MEKLKEKVVFYFPWKEISGGPYYLTKLADDLADTNNYEVYYIDYKNGITSEMIKNKSVKKIDYNDENFVMPFDEPIILITPIYWAHKLPNILNKKTRIVFLNWHYCCIPVLRNDSGWKKNKINKLLNIVSKTNSCFFLDYSHLLGQNTKHIKFRENFVPIILRNKCNQALKTLVNENEINIGILGRIDGDKVYSCLNVLDNLSLIKTDKKINVHIIGDGCHRTFFENECQKAQYTSKGINIIMHGIILNDNLNEFLSNKIDVLFAMGTSVLEGAALGLPSVIIPSNCEKFYDNKYVYIQNSFKYCLGWFNTQIIEMNIKTIELNEVISDIYEKNLKEELGKKALEYYEQNHLQNIDKFIQAIEVSNLKYEQLIKINKLDFTEKIFSIKNQGTQKIITILGIKIKIKRKNAILNATRSIVQEELNKKIDEQNKNLKLSTNYQVSLYSKVGKLHERVFPKYKNLHQGETAVLIASGPTVNFYDPKILGEDVRNIAVNGSFKFDKVNFDYLFLQDYSGLKESVAKIPYAENLKNTKKFYGIMSPVPHEMVIPEQIAIRDNAERYYAHSVCYDANIGTMLPYCDWALDLASEPFMCHGTIPLIAMQFLLYCNFSKIYLVGCDCSIGGHFSEDMEKQVTKENELEVWKLGWNKMKDFAQQQYPETEIISINPVGLKGIFKDVYTDDFLNNYPEKKDFQILNKTGMQKC